MTKKLIKSIKNIRTNILKKTFQAQSSHIGSCFSIVELLAVLYFKRLRKKDTFILSKGHAALALYCTLFEKKLLPKKELDSYGKNNSTLMSHVSHKVKNVKFSTGSLGHGLAIAAGMAIANRKNKIFVVLSDGELMEGSVWETVLIISSLNLNNIIIVIDNNDLQSATRATNTHPSLYPIKEKFKNFGWDSQYCDGHNSFDIYKKILKKKKINRLL